MQIREATADDIPFLRDMLDVAALGANTLPNLMDVYRQALERDEGATLVAEIVEQRVGAAWYRFYTETAPGYGFIDTATPELTIAVENRFRQQGIGRSLMRSLVTAARRNGITALSLNVEANNEPAQALYSGMGFIVVRTEILDGSLTMRKAVEEG